MSIPEACIEAAHICQPTAEVRARRVILALASDLPESAVEKAVEAWLDDETPTLSNEAAVAKIIAAFLKHVAGETP